MAENKRTRRELELEIVWRSERRSVRQGCDHVRSEQAAAKQPHPATADGQTTYHNSRNSSTTNRKEKKIIEDYLRPVILAKCA